VASAFTAIIREAPRHRQFMKGLEELATSNPSPLTFLQRLPAVLDIKADALLPVQNLVRFHAFARGITAHTTLERLVAIREAGGLSEESETQLREAFISLCHLQLRHHANRVRAGRPPDNLIETGTLRPVTRATLLEAIREAEAAHRRFARPAAPA
jgi:CBS domain-containing protein